MKKIKKILLVAVAATMLASTTAFAADTTTTTAEAAAKAGKTYGDQLKELLASYGVPAQMQNDMITILDTFELSNDDVVALTGKCNEALALLEGKTNPDEIKKIVMAKKQQFLTIKDDVQALIPGLVINPDFDTYDVQFIHQVKLDKKVLFTWKKADLSPLTQDTNLITALTNAENIQKIADAATKVVENGSTTIDPSTVTPGDVDDDPTVDPDDNYTEEEKAFLEKWNAKAKEYEEVKATYNADKTLKNALAVRDKLREFKELLDTCPESLKAELQAKYDACAAEVDAILAAFGSSERVDANQSGTSTFAPSNKGTLAKTATNNGNMAVAGLAMIAVAGTVFVVSKKKIAE